MHFSLRLAFLPLLLACLPADAAEPAVAQPNAALWTMIRYRILSFCLVVGTGFLMLTSMVVSTIVAAAGEYMSGSWPRIEPLGQWLTMAR